MKKYNAIKLKHKQTKNFNDKIGIYNSDGLYYIFFDYSDNKYNTREGLGYFLGKGNSVEECMIDALKNLNSKMIDMAEKLEKQQELNKLDPFEYWYGNKDEDLTLWTNNGIVQIGDDEK